MLSAASAIREVRDRSVAELARRAAVKRPQRLRSRLDAAALAPSAMGKRKKAKAPPKKAKPKVSTVFSCPSAAAATRAA